MLRSRRRPHYATHLCALTAAVLLLLSVSILYIRLTSHQPPHPHHHHSDLTSNPLLEDSDPDDRTSDEDRIDILDDTVQEDPFSRVSDEEEEEDDIFNHYSDDDVTDQPRVSKYYYDHVQGVIRRAFDKRSIDQWEDYVNFDLNSAGSGSGLGSGFVDLGFGSDDVVLDDNVRRKLAQVKGVEDALLLKVSPLKEGWGDWFEKKSDFLRRDRMFKSNLEMLNPMSNPFLQDPDGAGVTGLTKGDKMIQKRIVNEFKKVPFGVSVTSVNNPMSKTKVESENKVAERRTLDEGIREVVDKSDEMRNEFSGQIYADGKRWGYFPGLHPRLSFSNFMDAFFRKGKCSMRVFMVWNSPPWMFTVRHQRGLESLLFYHPDACVLVFSETLELNFFDSFVKDGFKVAVAMPNLDELLKDTPTHEFASVWFEWRKTKFYPTHYSELIRLAALYKYGGIYLDSDVIVIKPLYSLSNMVGLEDESSASDLNGAVMVFRKHSPFIMECLKEFYASYDDTNLRWNGADLLTRVGSKFLHEENGFKNQMELKLQPFFAFFPISRKSITRYFTQPTTDAEKADQDALYQKIVDEALVFHFWNSLTSSLVPEAGSLAARLIDRHCIRCSDML
ncbi:putative glycosyltransferase, DXD sugar-binding, alpha 1,4-glycosyltransferase [Helianthus debilis subsp. tardiflorus]